MLHMAVKNNNSLIVKYLLKKNLDINQVNHDGDSALNLAIARGHFKIVKFLCD